MKLKDILVKVGPAVLSAAYPPAAPAIAAINAMLPKDKQLQANCTGLQINDALSLIDPEAKKSLLQAEYSHVEAVMSQKASTMNTANAAENENYQETRAYIAKSAFHIVAAVTLIIVGSWSAAALNSEFETVAAIMDGWPMVIALLGPFASLLYAYMGVLKAEYRDRLNASNGKQTFGSLASIAAILKK